MDGGEYAATGAAGQTYQRCCLRPNKKASLCGCTMMMMSSLSPAPDRFIAVGAAIA
jgi:hypothetical protein